MTEPPTRSCLVHVHIPKTAGRALHHALRQCFEPTAVFPFVLDQGVVDDAGAGRSLPHRARVLVGAPRVARQLAVRRRRFVSCHTVPPWLDLDQAVVVVVLREPIERVVSLYRHVRRNPHHPLHDAASRSFDAFVDTAARSPRFRDRQSRMLALAAGAELEGPALAEAALATARRPDVIVGDQRDLTSVLQRLGVDRPVPPRNQSTNTAPDEVDVDRVRERLAAADQVVYEALSSRPAPTDPVPGIEGMRTVAGWRRPDQIGHDGYRAWLALRCLRAARRPDAG